MIMEKQPERHPDIIYLCRLCRKRYKARASLDQHIFTAHYQESIAGHIEKEVRQSKPSGSQ